MKLLFDENLSPSLVQRLQDIFPGSQHVHDCSLGAADDALVWSYARANGFVIVSKDSDFHERGVLHGFPPKVIWLRTGNCTTTLAEKVIRAHSVLIHDFESDPAGSTLVLP